MRSSLAVSLALVPAFVRFALGSSEGARMHLTPCVRPPPPLQGGTLRTAGTAGAAIAVGAAGILGLNSALGVRSLGLSLASSFLPAPIRALCCPAFFFPLSPVVFLIETPPLRSLSQTITGSLELMTPVDRAAREAETARIAAIK